MYFERIEKKTSTATLAEALAIHPGMVWLDGSTRYGRHGRFSYLSSNPVERHHAKHDECFTLLAHLATTARRSYTGKLISSAEHGSTSDVPAQSLDNAGPDKPVPPALERLPRYVGHVAYDGKNARDTRPFMPVCFHRYDAFFVEDNETGERFIAGDSQVACQALYRRCMAGTANDGSRGKESISGSVSPDRIGFTPILATDGTRYVQAIHRALAYIRAGEVYEINLSRRFRSTLSEPPFLLWQRFRQQSPVPLGFFFAGEEQTIMGASMERFMFWEGPGGLLSTEPIKGTVANPCSHHPASRSALADEATSAASPMRQDPKEHAEHVMVVDLMRNDLGKVATAGTVQVTELMAEMPFAGLSHMISTVQCKTRPAVGLGEIFEAMFPPGSITGTPKKRAIEIIAELEEEPRGVYTGAIGMIDRQGGASFAVAIRTATAQDGELFYSAGGGIVADSIAEKELQETDLKAQAFHQAVCGSATFGAA